jgi:LAO/AO transport system kinase
LGGLHPHIIEIMTVMQAAGFDELLVETVGVGQSEIEIAGLADTTVVVVVPEAGDEVQTMKAGIMEIADIFVVNKADRPEADAFVHNLHAMLAPAFSRREQAIPILKTIATTGEGVPALAEAIELQQHVLHQSERKYRLLAEKAYRLIQQQRMQSVDKNKLLQTIQQAADKPGFNLFSFVEPYYTA